MKSTYYVVSKVKERVPIVGMGFGVGLLFKRHTHGNDLIAARESLTRQSKVGDLAGFDCDHLDAGIQAAGCLLGYQRSEIPHINRPQRLSVDDDVHIDAQS